MVYNMNVDNISKERFEKAKKKIIKKYPGGPHCNRPKW